MLFGEFNDRGEFVRERAVPVAPPHIPRWIDGRRMNKAPDDAPENATPKELAAVARAKAAWEKATPIYRPIHLVETPLDPVNYKPNGFQYRLEADGTVSKIMLVSPLTDEEKEAYAIHAAKETRKAALPDYDETIELIVNVLKIVVDRQLMTEVPGDPRTRVSISQEAYNQLQAISRTLGATPLPNRINIENRIGEVKPDTQPKTQRDVDINILNDRVDKVAANKGLPQALRDALVQVRKLIT